MRRHGASDVKYRFAWTYPIVFSPHDPNTLYVGGNLVFKIDRRGAELAADQPRSHPRRSGNAEADRRPGQPATRSAPKSTRRSSPSPNRPTKPGRSGPGRTMVCCTSRATAARTGQNITPPALPEWTLISCIELSPFDAGTAYIAATRYKLDDYHPIC